MSELTKDQKLAFGGLCVTIVGTIVAMVIIPVMVRLWTCDAGTLPCEGETVRAALEERLTPRSRFIQARAQTAQEAEAAADERQRIEQRAEQARIAEDEWQAERARRLAERRAELARIDEEEWQTRPALARSVPVSFSDNQSSPGVHAVPPLAGRYELESFVSSGRPLMGAGNMQITQLETDLFSYAATAINFESGAEVYYDGLLRRRATHWTGVTRQSNDPHLPISAYTEASMSVQFDGTTLVVTNGMTRSVWRK
jgi:hypothetical protein